MATFTVTNLSNSPIDGSLRRAVIDANVAPGADLIVFAAGLTGTIMLIGTDIGISDAVELRGPGSGLLTIDGSGNSSRIMRVNTTVLGADVTISGLTMANGSGGSPELIATIGLGGAFYAERADVTLNDVAITGSRANITGGGIEMSSGTLTLLNSTVANNTAPNGGGIHLTSGSLTVRNSTISGNSVTGSGAGLALGGGTTLVQNTTIFDNEITASGAGAGIFLGAGALTLQSTIVAGNTNLGSPDDLVRSSGTLIADHDLIQQTPAAGTITTDNGGNIFNQNPQLGALQNNGGATPTHRPLASSPAIDAGANPAALPTDQRGFERTVGAATDIGAVESQSGLPRSDFNGDFFSDILWQNDNGAAGIWLMNGFNVIADSGVGFNPGPTWNVIGSGDFNRDGRSDILWQNDDGAAGIWLMNGLNVIADGGVGFNPGPSWKVKDAGDFDADGRSDILWQNDDGTAGIWLMDGLTRLAGGNVGFNPGPTWHVRASGDFNGDGKSDILWQNDNGTAGIWLMDGLNRIAGANVGFNPGPSWKVKDAGDFNADGRSDILWQNDNGAVGIWLMDGFTTIADGGVAPNVGPSWHVKASGDYNRDGRSDILWQNDNGTAGIWLMDGLTRLDGANIGFNPGPSWHVVAQDDLM